MPGARSVVAARSADQQAGGGANPTLALHSIRVKPVPVRIAKNLLVRHHYLHSLPGGTKLAFGVFMGHRLLGAMTLGAGPANAHRLVEGATRNDCITFTRLWLSDELPRNSESRVIGIVMRALRKNTSLKFLLSYADPSQGHLGVIYQATGWLYVGLSYPTPLYDIGDGKLHHSRSLSHAIGTHSKRYFKSHGVDLQLVPQVSKHRYVYFLVWPWRDFLNVPVLSYPQKENHGTG